MVVRVVRVLTKRLRCREVGAGVRDRSFRLGFRGGGGGALCPMAHSGRGDLWSSSLARVMEAAMRASPEDVEALREQLHYTAMPNGWSVAFVLERFRGEGRLIEDLMGMYVLGERRSRDMYVLGMPRETDAGPVTYGELMVLKVEKAEDQQWQSHMERMFLLHVQQEMDEVPGFIASCYWSGVLEGRDACIWEFAQPTFGVIAVELAEDEWAANVAAALLAGCFAMAREVVEGLRHGILFGALPNANRYRHHCL